MDSAAVLQLAHQIGKPALKWEILQSIVLEMQRMAQVVASTLKRQGALANSAVETSMAEFQRPLAEREPQD
jgi:hypothetical protein